jgi:uncharacterized repeat protein (TIGR01451 family)
LKFSSTTAGTITGTATATLSLNGTSVTVTTDGSGDNSAAANKLFIAGTLEWLKHDGSDALLGGAVFTVCRLQKWNSDLNGGAGALADTIDVCFDVTDDITAPDDTDAPPGDRDGTAGEFKLGGLLLGEYSVKEKTAPAGYTIDPDSTVDTLSTTKDSVKIATAFVNILPPVLTITKVPDNGTDTSPDGTVHPGDNAVFKITVKNDVASGGATATGVELTDTLPVPSGITWSVTSVSPNTVSCSISGTDTNILGCGPTTLAAGASFVVTVTSSTLPSTILVIPPSPAGSPLEIDGNLDDDAVAGKDWKTLPDSTFTCTPPRLGCDIDLPTGRNDNSFGQGTKEDTPVPKIVKGSIPNNKSDLLRFYLAKERFGSNDYLYLAWSRVQEPTGTTNMDFELNQSSTASSNGVTPVRSDGDILVRYDLSQGGVNPQLAFHRWITTGSPSNCEASNALPCWDKKHTLTTDVDAEINTVAVTDIGGSNLSARTFGEAKINLQDSGIFPAGTCTVFGKAYLKSRSSDAFTSEIKDFIAPIPINITNCAPITLNNTAYAKATNFTPSGGDPGDWISDNGKIEVTEDTSASLGVNQAAEQFARKPEVMALIEA